jgi:hypothetical protein
MRFSECAKGHQNPPAHWFCSTCGEPLTGRPTFVVAGARPRWRRPRIWYLLAVPVALTVIVAAYVLDLGPVRLGTAPTTTVPEQHTLTGSIDVGSEVDVVAHVMRKLELNGYSPAATLSMYGSIAEGDIPAVAASCEDGLVDSGYDDIRDGSLVTVRDAGGVLIGTTNLTGGELEQDGCKFSFTVQVPKAEFYQVQIGRREGLTSSYSELSGNGWHIDGSIGS